MLKIINISKYFDQVKAVNNVTINVENSSMIGIIGRSGAGKSTLLRTINRLTDATSGEILFQDQNILDLKKKDKLAWQKNCAMIFQQFNLVPRLDVLTNVMLGKLNEMSTVRASLKLFTSEERHAALNLLNKFGMMQYHKLILAHEPIASLDPLNARLVMESLRKIHDEQNITVICNLHTLDTAKQYCDRIIGMQNGEIVFDDLPSKLTNQKAREIYGAEADEAFEGTMTSVSLESADIKKTA